MISFVLKTLRFKTLRFRGTKGHLEANAIWEIARQNAAYLAIWSCDLVLPPGGGGERCDLGHYVAKMLRFCVCVWKATKLPDGILTFSVKDSLLAGAKPDFRRVTWGGVLIVVKGPGKIPGLSLLKEKSVLLRVFCRGAGKDRRHSHACNAACFPT